MLLAILFLDGSTDISFPVYLIKGENYTVNAFINYQDPKCKERLASTIKFAGWRVINLTNNAVGYSFKPIESSISKLQLDVSNFHPGSYKAVLVLNWQDNNLIRYEVPAFFNVRYPDIVADILNGDFIIIGNKLMTLIYSIIL